MKLNGYDEVIEYVSSIGMRAKDTEKNREVYKTLLNFTYEVMSRKSVEYVEYLYFLDCIAHNILGVAIFSEPLYEYKVKLELERYPACLMEMYAGLKKLKEIY